MLNEIHFENEIIKNAWFQQNNFKIKWTFLVDRLLSGICMCSVADWTQQRYTEENNSE